MSDQTSASSGTPSNRPQFEPQPLSGSFCPMRSQAPKMILTVLLTAVIVGGGVFLWQQSLFTAKETPQPIVVTENCDKVDGLAQELRLSEEQVGNLQDQLLETKVKLAAFANPSGRQLPVFRLGDSDTFVLVRKLPDGPNSVLNVDIYDQFKDLEYSSTGNVSLDLNSISYLYREEMSADIRLDVVGLDGSRLVLWETGADNSPGPCFDSWLAEGLTYLDLNEESPTRKPYQAPQSMLDEVRIEVDRCLAGLAG